MYQESLIGAANGIASLDAGGKVPASQLPSYVDDVLEFSGVVNFPVAGESGKIYIDTLTNIQYSGVELNTLRYRPLLLLAKPLLPPIRETKVRRMRML